MYDWIIKDIINASKEYLLISVSLGFISFIIFYGIRKHINDKFNKIDDKGVKKQRMISMIAWLAFFIYCFMLIAILFTSREPGSREGIHLRILCVFSRNSWARTYAIENIIMFIPFGIILPLTSSKFSSFIRCMFLGAMSCITIEVIQYMTKRGYSELDDILNNLLGTMIGYGVFTVVNKSMIMIKRLK